MPKLDGKVAVVTGSTKGIGIAVARALAEAGAAVVVSSRSADRVAAVASDLANGSAARVEGIPCDVSDPADCARLVEETVGRLGRLDVLVNNAGVGVYAPITELSVEDFDLQIGTNLSGAFYCSKAAARHLIASGDGWVINIGSLAGRHPFAGGTAYNATKFGLIGLSEAMMLDLRHEGVRVSLVMPGSVETSFRGAGPRPWALQAEDVARAVLGLLDSAAVAHVSRVEMRPSKPPQR